MIIEYKGKLYENDVLIYKGNKWCVVSKDKLLKELNEKVRVLEILQEQNNEKIKALADVINVLLRRNEE